MGNEMRSEGSGTILGTVQRNPKKLFATNSTNADILVTEVLQIPTTTEPVDDRANGVAVISPGSDNWMWLGFLGDGVANQEGAFAIWGWKKLPKLGRADELDLWLPFSLLRGTFLLGARVGIVNSPIATTDFFADTIAITTDNTYNIPSGTQQDVTDAIAWMFFDYVGYHKIEIEVTRNSGGTDIDTSVNGFFWTS